jgi:hypothetical protein
VGKSSGHKNVVRIDQASKDLHGWYARVGWKGETFSKWFPDNDHKRAALKEAIAWRNEIEATIGKPRTERWIRSPQRNLPGVSRRVKDGTAVYEVTWMPSPGKVRKTSYSIAAHGEREALRLAVELRREMERRYYGGELR